MKKKTQEEEEKEMKKRRKILKREKIYTCIKFFNAFQFSLPSGCVKFCSSYVVVFPRASRGLYAVVPLVKRLIGWCHVFSSSALGRSPTLFEV